jgi:DNA-binding transcriptional regulator YhcF (GntR family)
MSAKVGDRDRDIDLATAALRQRILNGLHVGSVSMGDRLPSVRTVARELGTSAKVALVAYRILSGERLVQVRPRSGVFVHGGGASVAARQAAESDWFVDAFVSARRSGVTLAKAFEIARERTAALSVHALVLDRNEDQLWSVRDELEREYGMTTSGVDLDAVEHPAVRQALEAELRRAHLVVMTPYERRAARGLTRRSGLPLCSVTMCRDLYAHVRALLTSEPVYFIVVDPRLGARLRRIFAGEAPRGHLRVLVMDRKPLDVPAEAPLYCTRLVRHRLRTIAGSPGNVVAGRLLAQSMTEAHVFSEETAEELTRFVLTPPRLRGAERSRSAR